MKISVLIPALGAVLALAACSSSGTGTFKPTGGNSSAPSGPSSSTTSSAPTSNAPTSPAGSSSPSSALSAGLLTVTDVGTGYVQVADDSPESALPCTPSAPPLFVQVPPRERSKVAFTNETAKVGVSEDVAVFADVATAQRAVAISIKGFACSTGSLDGTKATIKGPQTITVAGADSALIWDFAAGQFVATAALVRTGTKFVGLVFAAAPGAGQNVPIQQIIETATRKAAAIS